MAGSTRRSEAPGPVRAAAALLALVLLCGLPAAAEGVPALLSLPVELAAALALVALAPRPAVRHAAAGTLTVLLALQACDAVARLILGRPFVLAVDWTLVPVLFDTVASAAGMTAAMLGMAAVPVLVAAAWLVASWGLGVAAAAARAARPPVAGGVLLAVLALPLLAPEGAAPPLSDRVPGLLAAQGRGFAALMADHAALQAPETGRAFDPAALAAGLGGSDVTVVFLESYGRVAVEAPPYRNSVLPALGRIGATLDRRGLATVSGWLDSPTFGGQSWLAHATLLSGLRIDDQLRYRLLLSGRRGTLAGDLRAAGYRTALVAPAITRPWPEVGFYGFDRTWFAADMGYAGPGFDWVTMPDQYTLKVLDERVRRPGDAPLFAVVVLISGHAPWVPVPEVVPWDALGDGRIFQRWAGAGDPPAVVWRDPERIRRQYAMATAYVLGALDAWLGRAAVPPGLVILVGDHQPGPVVAGETADRAVPVHVIAGDPALLAPFRRWGLAPGMVPAADAPVRPMEDLRHALLAGFGAALPPAVAAVPGGVVPGGRAN